METPSVKYHLPAPSQWPVLASAAVFTLLFGTANWLHNVWFGSYLSLLGLVFLLYVIHGWFSDVIQENRKGISLGKKVDHSFRYGMCWFIFSEVMFFASFFGALFYTRVFVIPELSNAISISHILLWPEFQNIWPLTQNPNPANFIGPSSVMSAWGIATINTAILLTSGVTVTIAHVALLKGKRMLMITAQITTILLGISFLLLQAKEYTEAYVDKGLTLASGIYGSTFFMLTGFHGLHVTIGTIGLCIILYRMLKNDFSKQNHFAFEGVAWYWHFVDVVWLLLFVFVYWI